ncbi:Vat family streptogramin A O-acetyltransferase [Synechococcus sp. Nb3U1]|uniref:Vat family streptogramin A O-acetyltransferase n=1 Tax=Synechococcus sp. Nb3U1 TaxID=1914529 RepID=UPI001F0023F8|nr:Vat family streptogramin A O-acetyltransferase [Synechococcus sp. Nb3U1]MCF2970978.1 Vat family streptogramin A O-acetyltransferase [Synechococcus sp. Nb3U1]
MNGPDPKNPHPMVNFPQICFIKNTVSDPNISIGDYTYYDDPDDSEDFQRNVLYHYPFVGDRLIIGKFCAIARGVKFIMNGANHAIAGFSSFPFFIFGNGWEGSEPPLNAFPFKGDTIIGNDVWIGYDATLLPGVKVGDGAIIGAKAVVSWDVPPYTIVGGNPARVLRQRFSEEVIQELLQIAWWDWDIEKISRNLDKISGADIVALRTCT